MKVIEPSTPDEYQHYYDLRWKILRAPWNQPRGSEQDELEQSSTHLMVVDDRQAVIGIGRLHFNTISEAQIRYMAIAAEQQRKGIGTLLLQALEDRASELGAACIVLDSREQALGFYRKQGYELEGPGQVLFNTIPHVKMSKHFVSAE
jgi:ribosomal protein S18 acetylase RimI-like enzyme